jgi:hypothetical protein
MTACQAHAQVDPAIANPQTLLAALTRRGDVVDLIEVGTRRRRGLPAAFREEFRCGDGDPQDAPDGDQRHGGRHLHCVTEQHFRRHQEQHHPQAYAQEPQSLDRARQKKVQGAQAEQREDVRCVDQEGIRQRLLQGPGCPVGHCNIDTKPHGEPHTKQHTQACPDRTPHGGAAHRRFAAGAAHTSTASKTTPSATQKTAHSTGPAVTS